MELSSHSTSLLTVTYTSILPLDIYTSSWECHLRLKPLWMSPTRHPQARTDPQVTLAFPTNLKRVKQILVARQVHHTSVGSQGDAMIATKPRPCKSFSEWLRIKTARRASDLRNGLSRRRSMTTRGEFDPLVDGADDRGTIIKQLLRLYPPHTTKAISGPCISRDRLERLITARSPSFDSSHRTTTRSSTSSDTTRGPWSITSVNRKPLPRTASPYPPASDASSLASSNRNASRSSVAYGSQTPPPGPRNITSVIRKPVPGGARQKEKLVSFATDTIALESTRSKDTNGTARWKPSRRTNVAYWLTGLQRRIKEMSQYRGRRATVYTAGDINGGEGKHLRAGTVRRRTRAYEAA
jgi:hypothetical protein